MPPELGQDMALKAPWILKDPYLDIAMSPHLLNLYVETQKGCPAHNVAVSRKLGISDKRLEKMRNKERREQGHPKSLHWVLLKILDNENLIPKPLMALQKRVADHSATSNAWRIQGEATLVPEGHATLVAPHQLPQGNAGGGCHAQNIGTDESTTGRYERLLSGGSVTHTGLSTRGQLHHYDLPDWQPGGSPVRTSQIHMKRRSPLKHRRYQSHWT